MKKLTFFGLFLSMILGVSCSNEEIEVISPVEKEKSYAEFISELKSEFPEKTVYHDFNRPDFSKEVGDLLKDCISSDENETTTRATLYGQAYGPWGGPGGSSFNAPLTLYTGESWKKLTAIKMKYGKYIDGLQLYWVNDLGQASSSSYFGGPGGSESWVFLASDEYITGLKIYWGKYVDNITFITNHNVYTFGGPGGGMTYLNFGFSGFQMHGIYGSYGKILDKLGVYCYPNSLFPTN